MIAHKKRKERGGSKMKKIMALFAILMIALSILGFVYATWSDSIKITGTAEMGELIVGWLMPELEAGDNEEAEFPGEPLKWINDVTVTFEGEETSVHHDPPQIVYHTMKVTLTAAYPCLDAWVKVNLKNAGTIPAHIKSVTVTGKDLEDVEDLTWVDLDGDPETVEGGLEDPNAGPLGGPALVINLRLVKLPLYPDQMVEEKIVCNQIEPCTEEVVLLYLDIKEEAQQCHTYEFTITIEAAQWNWPILPP